MFRQKKIYIRYYILIILIFGTISTSIYSDIDKYLSIRDTLLTMVIAYDLRWGGETTINRLPCNQLNPQALKYLRYFLRYDNMLRSEYSGGLFLLGFIGEQDDLELLRYIVETRYKNNKERVDINFATGLGVCFGSLIARNVKGAAALFRKYAQSSFWHSEGQSITATNKKQTWRFLNKFIYKVLQFSKKDFVADYAKQKLPGDAKSIVEERDMKILQKIDKAYYRMIIKEIKDKTTSQDYSAFYKGLYKKNKEFIDNLIQKKIWNDMIQDTAKKKHNKTDGKKIKKYSSQSFEGMTEKILTDKKNITEEEKKMIKSLSKEAFESFLKIRAIVIEGKFEKIRKKLLDNGETLKQQSLRGLEKALMIEQKIMKRIKKIDAYNYRVGFSRENVPIVSFLLKNTKEISRLNIKNYSSNLTIDENGTLIVFMKKINGKWHWNPFGW